MNGLVIVAEILVAVASGGALAQLNGPTACDWRAKPGQMKARLTSLKHHRPLGGARRTAGAAVIALLLTGGSLLAYAAEPSAPLQLSKDVVGVVGSGDQLSLTLKEEGAAPRTLRIGETYKEGWTLQAVTPSVATLTKAGEVHEVGLNPTGQLSQGGSPAPATQVKVLGGGLDTATIDRLYQVAAERTGARGKELQETALKFGAAYLSLDQYKRQIAYRELQLSTELGEEAMADYRDLNNRVQAAMSASIGVTQQRITVYNYGNLQSQLADLPAAPRWLSANPYMDQPVIARAGVQSSPTPAMPAP